MSFNFRQVTGSSKYRAWKEWKKGEFMIMKVESFSPNKKNTKYMDITGKVLDHNFSQSDLNKEDRFSLNGTTGIQKAVDTGMKVGDTIKVVYGGSEIVKTGQWAGSKTHVIECYIADQDSNDVVTEATNLVAKAQNVL